MNKICKFLLLTTFLHISTGCSTVTISKNAYSDQDIRNILLNGKWYMSQNDPNYLEGYNVIDVYTEDNKLRSFVFADHDCKIPYVVYEANWVVQENKVVFTHYHQILPTIEQQGLNIVSEIVFIDGEDYALRNINNDFITYSTRKNSCGSEEGAANNKAKT